jgi:hypothetical protein
MDRERQLHRTEAFVARHRAPSLLLLANAWDALSARIVEEAAFEAVATTSGGVSWALGLMVRPRHGPRWSPRPRAWRVCCACHSPPMSRRDTAVRRRKWRRTSARSSLDRCRRAAPERRCRRFAPLHSMRRGPLLAFAHYRVGRALTAAVGGPGTDRSAGGGGGGRVCAACPAVFISYLKIEPGTAGLSAPTLIFSPLAGNSYFFGSTVCSGMPCGCGCIPGGASPCGLDAGAPPVVVVVGLVRPCG